MIEQCQNQEVNGMNKSIESIIIELGKLKPNDLRARYEALYGEPCFSKHKPFIIKRIVWKLQAIRESLALPPKIRQRAEQLAQGAEARLIAPVTPDKRSHTLPCTFSAPTMEPGGVIRKNYKGRNIVVQIADGGFIYDGQPYRSLSAIAKLITGTHVNGRAFFKVASV